MTDPKLLEGFFSQYLPGIKHVLDDYWQDNRAQAIEFLEDCLACGMAGWMAPYFEGMLHIAKTAPHTYTDPWQVL